jgi:hypothetical protein
MGQDVLDNHAMKRTKPIPKKRKPRRGPERDRKYLAFIRSFPCLLCARLVITQHTLTEAAHTGPHGMSQKAPDDRALPLCGYHHREGVNSLHRLGTAFWKEAGLDREKLVAYYQQLYKKAAI